jgi:hypothetical protein
MRCVYAVRIVLYSYFCKVYLHIIISCTPWSPKQFLRFWFSDYNFVCVSHLFIHFKQIKCVIPNCKLTVSSAVTIGLREKKVGHVWFKNVMSNLKSIYITGKCWLAGDHLLLRNFGPYGIISMAMLLRYFGLHGIIFMTVFTAVGFPVILNGQLTSKSYICLVSEIFTSMATDSRDVSA